MTGMGISSNVSAALPIAASVIAAMFYLIRPVATTDVVRRRTARTATGYLPVPIASPAPAAHTIIATQPSAIPVMAMASACSAAASRTRTAVTAHVMIQQLKDAVEAQFTTKQPKSAVRIQVFSLLVMHMTIVIRDAIALNLCAITLCGLEWRRYAREVRVPTDVLHFMQQHIIMLLGIMAGPHGAPTK